jgi:hypothetical protein
MNRKIAITFAIASIAAASAFADDATIESHPFKATMTREQVQAQLQQYRQAGTNPHADVYDHLTDFRSTRSRDDVKAEFLATRAMVSAMNAEDGGSAYSARRELPRVVGPQMASLPAAAE